MNTGVEIKICLLGLLAAFLAVLTLQVNSRSRITGLNATGARLRSQIAEMENSAAEQAARPEPEFKALYLKQNESARIWKEYAEQLERQIAHPPVAASSPAPSVAGSAYREPSTPPYWRAPYSPSPYATPSYSPHTYVPSSGSAGGPVHVSGYYRSNGTYVQPYTRSAPSR